MTIATQNHVSIIRGMQIWTHTQNKNIVSTTKPNLRQNKKTKLHQTELNKRKILRSRKHCDPKTRKKQTLFQIHHIIPQHMWKDNNIKKLLQKLGLTQNDRKNTVVLPAKRYNMSTTAKKNIPQKFRNAINRIQHATLHKGNHIKKYYDTIRNILSYISKLPVNLQKNMLYKFLSLLKNKLKKGEISLRRVNEHQTQNGPETPETKQEDCSNISDISIIERLENNNNKRISQSLLETPETKQEDCDNISDTYIGEQLGNITIRNTQTLTSLLETPETKQEDYDDISDISIIEQPGNITIRKHQQAHLRQTQINITQDDS